MLETTITLENETIDIRRWGQDDYSVEFHNGDYSVRGTLVQIIAEIATNSEFDKELHPEHPEWMH